MRHSTKSRHSPQEDAGGVTSTQHEAGLPLTDRNPTTSFLTATTLIYAIGAGITAAAGTRLALQLILVKRCKSHSFQLLDVDA